MADFTGIVDVPGACGGKEYAVSIGLAGDKIPVYSILRSPSPGAILQEFVLLGIRWHPPAAAKLYVGHIVFGLKFVLVVNCTVIIVEAVLGEGRVRAVTPLVGGPFVTLFCPDLTPGVKNYNRIIFAML